MWPGCCSMVRGERVTWRRQTVDLRARCHDNGRGSTFPPHEGVHFPEETMDRMLERRTLLKLGAAAATLGAGIELA